MYVARKENICPVPFRRFIERTGYDVEKNLVFCSWLVFTGYN